LTATQLNSLQRYLSDRLIGPAAQHVLRHPWAFIWQTIKGFKANQGLLLAGAVAYYALLSIVPLLILTVIALSQLIDQRELLATLGRYLEWLVPSQSKAIVTELSHFLDLGIPGRIVNVASRAAFRGDSPQHWHYAASKGAMVAMTRTIARGYAADGILCFAVAPGFTVSEMTESYLAGRGGAQIVADIPLGRVASTDEIAETIRWLASDAPASATGSVIDVNGASYVR